MPGAGRNCRTVHDAAMYVNDDAMPMIRRKRQEFCILYFSINDAAAGRRRTKYMVRSPYQRAYYSRKVVGKTNGLVQRE